MCDSLLWLWIKTAARIVVDIWPDGKPYNGLDTFFLTMLNSAANFGRSRRNR
jgi:hypothetical protein